MSSFLGDVQGDIPTEVSIEDKNINERLLLIEQLEEEETQSTVLLT